MLQDPVWPNSGGWGPHVWLEHHNTRRRICCTSYIIMFVICSREDESRVIRSGFTQVLDMNEAQVSKTQAVKKADSYLVHSRGMVLRTGSKSDWDHSYSLILQLDARGGHWLDRWVGRPIDKAHRLLQSAGNPRQQKSFFLDFFFLELTQNACRPWLLSCADQTINFRRPKYLSTKIKST